MKRPSLVAASWSEFPPDSITRIRLPWSPFDDQPCFRPGKKRARPQIAGIISRVAETISAKVHAGDGHAETARIDFVGWDGGDGGLCAL